MSSSKEHKRKGIIGTLVFHLCLLILFLFTGFTEPDPPIQEDGMPLQIRLGFEDAGSGDTFEAPPEQNTQVEEVVQQNTATTEDFVTQETPSIAKVVKSDNPSPKKEKTPEEIQAEKEQAEAKKLQNHLTNLFSKTKNTQSGNGNGGGNDSQSGVQGREYGGKYGGKTGGALPGGGNFVLGGRKLSSTPKIYDDSQDEGKVVVRIYVNQNGEVFRADPGIKGSTTTSAILFKKAKEAALKTKFNPDSRAPLEQTGSMTFIFVVGG